MSKAPFSPPAAQLELMARFTVELTAPVWELGRTSDLGTRRIIPITGGNFSGPKLSGEILNNGADWQIQSRSGVGIIETRYLLRLDGGDLVYLRTNGYRYGPPEVMAALAAGAVVDPASYYFRVHMVFETASTSHDWLNRALGVGYAMRLPTAVIYDAYLVT